MVGVVFVESLVCLRSELYCASALKSWSHGKRENVYYMTATKREHVYYMTPTNTPK